MKFENVTTFQKVHCSSKSVKQCGGSSLCVHGKMKYQCKSCVPCLCVHGKIKSRCEECAGSAQARVTCDHGKQKYRCKECAAIKTMATLASAAPERAPEVPEEGLPLERPGYRRKRVARSW